MLFNEALQNFITDVNPIPARLVIEAKFREKIPTILGFVYGRPVAEQVLDFHITNSMYGCVIEVKGYGFTLNSIHTEKKSSFSCNIEFQTIPSTLSIRYINCLFDNDLNIECFSCDMNFGDYGNKNSLYVENTKYFNGQHIRKMYLKNVENYSVYVIQNLNDNVHKEDPDFENFLMKIMLINCTDPDFYQDVFDYLPVIDMYDTSKMSSFINELHERYIKKDTLFKQSIELLDMRDI